MHNLDPTTNQCSECGLDLSLTPAQWAAAKAPSQTELDSNAHSALNRPADS